MALDLSLLELAERRGEGFVRLYRWEPWCLSFGRHEPALRRYDRARIERRGLDTVRRPTGGRAVWHARELTYAVAAPVAWFGTLGESYRSIHQAIAEALDTLGVRATLADDRPAQGVGAGACFAAPVGGEVMVGDGKLVGSAQLRQGEAFLQHGSLLLEDDQSLVAELTVGPVAARMETTLTRAAGRSISDREISSALATRFREWRGTWRDFDRDPDPLAGQHAARFRDPAWTWRR
jgi:lipoate-protein ligase A